MSGVAGNETSISSQYIMSDITTFMPKRVFKDPDLRHFAEKLRYTTEGRRYVSRWNKLNILRKLVNTPGANILLRQNYIRAADACSDALSDLEKRHQWPP